uniref:P-selectin-like n=1 Tax=Pundamilia nyererei TaxID=303518 RepID=A0A3B4H6D4_9CICH
YCKMLYNLFVPSAVEYLSSRKGGVQAWTYNYSTGPNQNWYEARKWCQKFFTDMVAIQNQEETNFLNDLLPFNQKYYWIGVHRVAGLWTSVNTSQSVPEEAQNWASAEPDTIPRQDCVEIYIKRARDTAKWNNENCNKLKGAVCYTASCKHESCSAHADCVESIGSHICKCHPGFRGLRCEEGKLIRSVEYYQGSLRCSNPYGSNHLNSSCHFLCEVGFRLIGAPQLICQANGLWNHPVPLCQVAQCPNLKYTNFSASSMNCSHPIAAFSYNSTCEFSCDEGYELIGQNQIICDRTGQWTATVPVCTVRKCSPVFPPVMGHMTCVDPVEPFSYGSWCNFTCKEGYYLTGDKVLSCLTLGQWSKPTPTCTAKKCTPISSPSHGSISCSDPNGSFSFASVCTSTCDEGFLLNGTSSTECTSMGMWTTDIPPCLAKKCPTLNSPAHGAIICSDPHGEFSFGSRCTTTCDEGFILNGTAVTECTAMSNWSTDIPHCLGKKNILNPFCSNPHREYSFASVCTSTCAEGFVLNGTAITECTSMGMWNRAVPHCLAERCPILTPPSHGTLDCSHSHGEFSFGSRCTSTCEDGFLLTGIPDTECTSAGTWSTEIPGCQGNKPKHDTVAIHIKSFLICVHTLNTYTVFMLSTARQCPLLAKSPQHGRMNCSHLNSPFSYGSQCDFKCNKGFWLKGRSSMMCNTSGHWNQDPPTCMSIGTAMLLYTGAGAGIAVVILLLIGLTVLIMKQFKKTGETYCSDAHLHIQCGVAG